MHPTLPFGSRFYGPRVSRASRARGWWLPLALAFLAATSAPAADFVVVSAGAIPQYQRPRDSRGAVLAETYVVSPGRYFSGQTRDRAAEATKFRAIITSLGPALAQQRYFPAKDPARADLLLIVHWGTTQTYEDPNRELTIEKLNSAFSAYASAAAENGGIADPGAMNELFSGMAGDASLAQRYLDENAELLGYKRSLRARSGRILPSEEEKTMRHELGEERYFLVVMAYDYRVLQKEKRRALVWTTHMNVRAAGNNFALVLPELTRAGAALFGRDTPDPVHIQPTLRRGDVQVGELRVLPETAPPPASPAAPQR
ncbi:hypothetical protein [Opitutus sp. ER46]|uniref:hypothetical protein n=1 Tax=Opitutus sp. ER46 TaxID=2161864 RepID=UPI000D322ED2|nr:hypothetical protein [Opitutus sp. ER46]PTX96620.1 hypothetical protein DB354_08155 [Opitutus sp. ER46]